MGTHFFVVLFAIAIGIVCPTSGRVVEHKDKLIFAHTVCIDWKFFYKYSHKSTYKLLFLKQMPIKTTNHYRFVVMVIAIDMHSI